MMIDLIMYKRVCESESALESVGHWVLATFQPTADHCSVISIIIIISICHAITNDNDSKYEAMQQNIWTY